MSDITILPDSRTNPTKTLGQSWNRGPLGIWVPIFCASCGAFGGSVPEGTTTSAFYLCDDKCVAKYGVIPGAVMVPDQVFFRELAEAQLEHYGRYLTEPELVNELADTGSVISRLAADRKNLTPKAGG